MDGLEQDMTSFILNSEWLLRLFTVAMWMYPIRVMLHEYTYITPVLYSFSVLPKARPFSPMTIIA